MGKAIAAIFAIYPFEMERFQLKFGGCESEYSSNTAKQRYRD